MTDVPERLQDALTGGYRLIRELGRGGMATVYLAEDLKHGRQVAVKVLHPELAAAIGPERFVREIQIAAKLTHPHILMLIDSGEAGGCLYYVMPFVDGESLRDRLVRERRLAVPDAVKIVEQVASALTYAHAQGVVHRDIKPENILLSGDQAIVADFGIARAVEAAGGEKLTGTGMAIGTPAYMSPEQGFGQAVDGRADVYALGCVMYEMVSGRLPFEADTPQGLLARHVVDTAPSLRTLDAEIPLFIDRAVSRALVKDPDQRFPSPNVLAETLREERVVARVGRHRMAVLPPVNITGDAEQQFLILGLHEALISQLGREDIAVLARTSVLPYANTEKPVREIGRELTVDTVVESSLFRSGDQVGIHARLTDARTEEGLWSGSYDGSVENVFTLYRELTGSIAREIHGALGPTTRPSIPGMKSVDPTAYEKYMRGRVHQQNFTPADLERALNYYQAALEIEPDYAPAHAGISLVRGSQLVLGLVPAETAGAGYIESARRAIELDPELAEAHQARAQAYTWYEFDWERAEASYERAIALDPNEPQARIFYAHMLASLHRVGESNAHIEQALRIDPLNPFTQMLSGIQRGLTGRLREGMELLNGVPPNPLRSFALSWMHYGSGDLEEGTRHYGEYFVMLGDTEVAEVLAAGGDGPERALVQAGETLMRRAEDTFVKPNKIWFAFGWGGDVERTIDWMERGLATRDHEVAYQSALPHREVLRTHPRFHRFLAKLKLPVPPARATS